jgi:DNA-binding response OmpR family regulator
MTKVLIVEDQAELQRALAINLRAKAVRRDRRADWA